MRQIFIFILSTFFIYTANSKTDTADLLIACVEEKKSQLAWVWAVDKSNIERLSLAACNGEISGDDFEQILGFKDLNNILYEIEDVVAKGYTHQEVRSCMQQHRSIKVTIDKVKKIKTWFSGERRRIKKLKISLLTRRKAFTSCVRAKEYRDLKFQCYENMTPIFQSIGKKWLGNFKYDSYSRLNWRNTLVSFCEQEEVLSHLDRYIELGSCAQEKTLETPGIENLTLHEACKGYGKYGSFSLYDQYKDDPEGYSWYLNMLELPYGARHTRPPSK